MEFVHVDVSFVEKLMVVHEDGEGWLPRLKSQRGACSEILSGWALSVWGYSGSKRTDDEVYSAL